MLNLTDEEIFELNDKHIKENIESFKEFKLDLAKGICWVCKKRLDSFDETRPCQHWLLLPDGFRKKHFKKLFDAVSIDKIEGFLRWYVNAHEPIKNINDLKEEHVGDKVKDLTIKYGRLEWSLSCSDSDLKGDHGAHGPHYHFQMRVDGKPMHDYSDRHIKLSEYEVWVLEVEQGKHPPFRRRGGHGMGMQDAFEDVEPEQLLKTMRNTDDYENAAFHISSLIMADEGHTISGDDIANLYEESKATGVPMHQLIKKLKNVKSTVIIEPGKGVPEPAQRIANRGKKSSK